LLLASSWFKKKKKKNPDIYTRPFTEQTLRM